MTYFDLFEIPVQLSVDRAGLPRKYFELSRKFHPDFHANSSEESQAESLEKTALLNKAFRTFQDPDETIKYVLKLKGLLEEEEKYELPPAFLMEVMEINESMMDADDPGTRAEIETRLSQLEHEIYDPVRAVVEGYREDLHSREDLLRVKAYYYQKKYLDRIRQSLRAGL